MDAEKFDSIAQLLKSNTLGELRLRVGNVDGFYSEWSPDIFANYIKVLSAWSENDIELPDDLDYVPPRTGKVRKFELTAISVEKTVDTNDSDEDDVDDEELIDAKPLFSGATKTASVTTPAPTIPQLRIRLWPVTMALWVVFFGLLIVAAN